MTYKSLVTGLITTLKNYPTTLLISLKETLERDMRREQEELDATGEIKKVVNKDDANAGTDFTYYKNLSSSIAVGDYLELRLGLFLKERGNKKLEEDYKAFFYEVLPDADFLASVNTLSALITKV